MPRLEYFIVCASTSVDVERNSISLFHLLEDLFPDQFPASLETMEAVSLWNLDPEDANTDFQATLRITLPDKALSARFAMNLSAGWKRYRATIKVTNIPLPCPGELRFDVELNGVHSASHIVNVHEGGSIQSGRELRSDDVEVHN
jgi:hypothetical protein